MGKNVPVECFFHFAKDELRKQDFRVVRTTDGMPRYSWSSRGKPGRTDQVADIRKVT